MSSGNMRHTIAVGFLPALGWVRARIAASVAPLGRAAREGLPARADDVAVARLELDRGAAPAQLLGRDHLRAGPGERLERELACREVIPHRDGEQLNRLLRRVRLVAVPPDLPDAALREVAEPLGLLATHP